jgi:hypothetical protein
MSEWDSLPWWRRFKEASVTERVYVIVLVVFFVLFFAGAFFFDNAVLAFLVPVLLVIAVILEQPHSNAEGLTWNRNTRPARPRRWLTKLTGSTARP